MSEAYDSYLREHIGAVQQGFQWIQANLPELLPVGADFSNISEHDSSKRDEAEYLAYDLYFYSKGGKTSKVIKEAFDIAWLHHIHKNPHHWQYWVLLEDEGGVSSPKALPMPYPYILEMICDWWAFSWKSGNLYEIFDWYKDHEKKMLLEKSTKQKVDDILEKIRKKLTELDEAEGVISENKEGKEVKNAD